MFTRRHFSKLAIAGAVSSIVATDAFAQSPTKILFVHGRSQGGRSAQEIRRQWLDALRKGIENAGLSPRPLDSVSVPFYGDELDRLTEEFDLPLASSITARGNANLDEFLAFQEALANEIRVSSGVPNEVVDQEYGENPRPRGPQNWEWVQAIIRAIDKHHEGITQGFLESFLRDVFLYTRSSLVEKKINDIVLAEMSSEPTVVIGHSLGSVVAYNILRSSQAHDVPLFVTLGSPLGIRAIRNRYRPLSHPKPVSKWVNAFDERDVVALFALDSENFDVMPTIENISEIRNQTRNRHGIDGYLDKPLVAQRIYLHL